MTSELVNSLVICEIVSNEDEALNRSIESDITLRQELVAASVISEPVSNENGALNGSVETDMELSQELVAASETVLSDTMESEPVYIDIAELYSLVVIDEDMTPKLG